MNERAQASAALIGRTVHYAPLFQPGLQLPAVIAGVEIVAGQVILQFDNGSRRYVSEVVFPGDLDQA
jgi:hypothetical protein